MSIVDHKDWQFSEKGLKDAARHREKIDDHIRKNVRNVIAEESIITKKHGKTVRIPVKGLKDYRFIYGRGEGGSGGVGQGKGKAKDIIARREKDMGNDGKAGNQPGEDYMETEVDIDYLIDLMLADLGLPYIEEKTKKEQLVPVGWKFETISKVGIRPRVHKNKTLMETIKRTALFANEIINETGCDEEIAYKALAQAYGDLDEAIKLVKENKVDPNADINDFVIDDDDLRFKNIEEEIEKHSNAAVVAMMDVSGSMTTDKKYMARSMLFWLVEFLKKSYDNVQIRFIVHTTDARVVDEDTFFHKGESGGTMCYTAFDLATYVMETEFPNDAWNRYVIYVTDGEDWDANKTVVSIKAMLEKGVNMLGYCEICPLAEGDYSNLLETIKKSFQFRITSEAGTNFYKNDELRFLAGKIRSKDHIYPMLKHLLFEKKKK